MQRKVGERLLGLVIALASCTDDPPPAGGTGESSAGASSTSGTSDATASVVDGSSSGDPEVPELPDAWLRSDRRYLRDSLDRVVVLRGVNARVEGVFDVTFDDGRLPLEEIPAFAAEDAARMRQAGFNVLRLPINWSGIEPEQGSFDEAYLDRVDEVVQLCAAAGIHVILDFHQDAYSKEIGEDGAPLWAIEPPPTELLGGPLGDTLEMRRFSAQVLAAFVGFFDDGDEDPADQWLQPAFGEMARHVAERFADEPWVLGLELFNEPVAADHFVWSFHERVVPMIREVDERHLLLFEPNVLRSATEQAPVGPDPFLDDQGVYAPHLYTFSFSADTTPLETLSIDDLRPNVEAATSEAAGWQTPLFVGEWGISPAAPNADLYVRSMYDLFDEGLLHSTVWLWKEPSQGRWGFYEHDDASGSYAERPEVFAAHARPYAAAIAGEPVSLRYDVETLGLELRLEGRDDGVPSVLHVPAAPYYPAAFTVYCDGVAVATAADRDAATGQIDVPCGGAGERRVELQPD